MYDSKDSYQKMFYRQTRTHDVGVKEDIFDSDLYRHLRNQQVKWGQEVFSGTYFEDDTDVALGLGTDGAPLFQRKRISCWPLILTNYSLAPELRTRKEFQM